MALDNFQAPELTEEECKALWEATFYVTDYYVKPDPPTPAMTAQDKLAAALGKTDEDAQASHAAAREQGGTSV